MTAAKKPALIDRRGPSSGLGEDAIVREMVRIGTMDPAIRAAFEAATGRYALAPMELGLYVDWLTAEWRAYRDSDARVDRAISLIRQALRTDDSELAGELLRQRNALEITFSEYEHALYLARLKVTHFKTQTGAEVEVEVEVEVLTAPLDGSESIH
jgi:hypothetical protein